MTNQDLVRVLRNLNPKEVAVRDETNVVSTAMASVINTNNMMAASFSVPTVPPEDLLAVKKLAMANLATDGPGGTIFSTTKMLTIEKSLVSVPCFPDAFVLL